MRMKGTVKRIKLSPPGVAALGLVVVALVMTGCGSDRDWWEYVVDPFDMFSVPASETDGIEPTFTTCGEHQVETLWAAGTTDVGIVTVANDCNYLYVKYSMAADWRILKGRVHVGADVTDYPKQPDLTPLLAEFDYGFDAPEGEAFEQYTVEIPFTDLGLEHGDCGTPFYVFAWGYVAEIDDGGGVITETAAWAGTGMNQTESPQWMYYIEYQLQCCDQWVGCEFRTQSQGGWGTVCHGQNPGCYRDEWFDIAFPEGDGYLTIGCGDGYTMTFTSSQAVQEFLPSGGKPGPLEFNYVNPTGKTEAGVLASQVLALALTLGFDSTDPDFCSSEELLVDLVICNTGTAFDCWAVGDLFDEANVVLGGCESEYRPGEIADALAMVNENYVDGKVDLGFLCAD